MRGEGVAALEGGRGVKGKGEPRGEQGWAIDHARVELWCPSMSLEASSLLQMRDQSSELEAGPRMEAQAPRACVERENI